MVKCFLALMGVFWMMSCTIVYAAEREISYQVDGQKVVGTLTMPEKAENVPVVLMLHGYTANRNESVSSFVPEGLFGRMAHELEKKGIASLRIDMRGSGKSEGTFANMTVESEMQRLDVCPAAQIGVCGGDIDGAEIGKFAGSENMLPMH